MATKTENPLLEKLVKDCTNAREALQKALSNYEQAKEFCNLLPEVITGHDWYFFRQDEPGKWYMETWCLDEEKADTFIKELKIVGVYGFHSKFINSNCWHYTGSFVIGDNEFTVKVDGGSKPPLCRIEETKEWKEVISYKAICDETGEEVK